MPKNKGKGGKKHKRGKKLESLSNRELLTKEQGQEYGIIEKVLGSCRFMVTCADGKSRLGHVRGNMQKRIWIQVGDCVLVGKRDFQDDKCDIIHRYSPDEYRQLKRLNEIPTSIETGLNVLPEDKMTNPEEEDNIPFDFEEI